MYYAGGVYESSCPQPFAGGHAMSIVGYTAEYWIIKNSWGVSFGEEGYVYWSRVSPICNLQQVLGVTVVNSQTTTTPAPQPTTTTAPPPTTTAVPPAPTTPNPGSCLCAAGYTYNAATDACYKVTDESVTFDAATRLCAADNGSLVAIHSAAENDWLVGKRGKGGGGIGLKVIFAEKCQRINKNRIRNICHVQPCAEVYIWIPSH